MCACVCLSQPVGHCAYIKQSTEKGYIGLQGTTRSVYFSDVKCYFVLWPLKINHLLVILMLYLSIAPFYIKATYQ